MKFRNPLHKFFNRRDHVAVLNEAFASTKQVTDVGQRLLLLREISNEAYSIIDDVNMKTLGSTLPPAVAGIGCMIGGAATANPVLLGAGLAMAFGGVGARMSMGQEAFDDLCSLRERCREDEKAILATISPDALARSAKFEMVMRTFPELKSKFSATSGIKNDANGGMPKSQQDTTQSKGTKRNRFKP